MTSFFGWYFFRLLYNTLPETNIAPGNQWLEDEIPFGMAHFQERTVSFREGRRYKKICSLSKFGRFLGRL